MQIIVFQPNSIIKMNLTNVGIIILVILTGCVLATILPHIVYKLKMKFLAKPVYFNKLFQAGQTWKILTTTENSGVYYAIVMGPFDEKNIKVTILPYDLKPGTYGCNEGIKPHRDLIALLRISD
jgi:hypothetical protein